MLTWIQTAIGLFFIAGGSLALWILLFDKFENDTWRSRVFGVALVVAIIGAGIWLAWPLALGVRDLFAGSHGARKLVVARESARATSVQADYASFRTGVKVGALIWAASAPFLCWLMRRAEPDYRRAWAQLIAIPTGYAVLVQWGIGAFPGSVFETSLKGFLDRNDTAWAFALYAETMWLGPMVGAYFAGLPVGPWTILLVPVAVTPYWIGYYLGYPFWKLMLCWLAAVMIGGIVNAVRKSEEEAERSRRIARAREFERKVLSGEKGHEFALYLRPFRVTGTLEAQQVSDEADPLDFETILAAAVRPKLRLLGLNKRRYTKILGADYLYHGCEWEDVVRRLAHAARIIFVLPGVGTTIDKEIKGLRHQRLLSKCVFIMPETMTGKGWQFYTAVPTTVKHTEYRDIDHSGDWAAAQQAMLELGLALPAYLPEGALFTLHDDGRLKVIARLHLAGTPWKVRRIRKALDDIRSAQTAIATSSGR
jgi:hypothetical protein